MEKDQAQIIKSLRMQLLIERSIIGAVLLVLLLRWAYGMIGSAPYAIMVNDRPIAFLTTRESAEKVLSAVKRAKAGTEQRVEFVQDVKIARYRGGGPVVAESKAIETVGKRLRVRMEKYVIMADGKPAVAVDSQELAASVLEGLKAKFGAQVSNLLEEPQFKENVKVELTQVDQALYRRDVQSAIQQVLHPVTVEDRAEDSRPSEYVVKQGDIAANIAKRYRMPLEDLEKLNPGRNLARLQIGDKIRVSGKAAPPEGKARITVVVRDLVTETRTLPYTTETVSSRQMYQGKQFQSQPGRNGLRSVKMAVTYENGVRTSEDILEEQVIREMTPRRIVVGIKPR